MNLLKSAWSWLRKLPVAKYIKPIWKGLLKEKVAAEFAELRRELPAAIAANGAVGVRRVFDRWQAGLKAAVLKQAWLPGDLEQRLASMIEEWGNKGEDMVAKAVELSGPPAALTALAAAEKGALEAIEAL